MITNGYNRRVEIIKKINDLEAELSNIPKCPCCPKNGEFCIVEFFRTYGPSEKMKSLLFGSGLFDEYSLQNIIDGNSTMTLDQYYKFYEICLNAIN